ncbi:MAG: flagellar hook-basal body complex protein [Lachnospiraceae bacterium]|nr:flagellar hook-basal body complex protein [Lachnospiraceae bacterium]
MSADNLTYPPEATTKGTVTGILDKNDTDVNSEAGKTINLNLYDALGYEYTARFIIKSTDVDGEYSAELTKLLDAKGNEIDISGASDLFGSNTSVADQAAVTFNTNGYAWNTATKKLTNKDGSTDIADLNTLTSTTATDEQKQAVYDAIAAAYGYEGNTQGFLNLFVTVSGTDTSVEQMILNAASGSGSPSIFDPDADATTTTMDFTAAGRSFTGQVLKFDTDTGLFDSINGNILGDTTIYLSKLIANTADNTSNFSDIALNWSGISMFNNNGTSTLTATYGDKDGIGTGRKLGDMIGVSIQRDGMIYASYDNGMTKLLGQIATASFPNSSGLEKHGDNLYQATMNSGSFDGIGVDVTASGGYMSTGVLEMSNVDLSAEFTEMITTQRGFQANSRIITVSDTLLEELTNLKR